MIPNIFNDYYCICIGSYRPDCSGYHIKPYLCHFSDDINYIKEVYNYYKSIFVKTPITALHVHTAFVDRLNVE